MNPGRCSAGEHGRRPLHGFCGILRIRSSASRPCEILNTDNPINRPVGDEVTREKMVTRMALTDGIKDIQVSN